MVRLRPETGTHRQGLRFAERRVAGPLRRTRAAEGPRALHGDWRKGAPAARRRRSGARSRTFFGRSACPPKNSRGGSTSRGPLRLGRTICDPFRHAPAAELLGAGHARDGHEGARAVKAFCEGPVLHGMKDGDRDPKADWAGTCAEDTPLAFRFDGPLPGHWHRRARRCRRAEVLKGMERDAPARRSRRLMLCCCLERGPYAVASSVSSEATTAFTHSMLTPPPLDSGRRARPTWVIDREPASRRSGRHARRAAGSRASPRPSAS